MNKHSKTLALFLAFSLVMVLAGIAQQQAEETVVCPVSGKEMKKSEAKVTYEYQGKMYYFRCEKCKEAFIKNPEKYLHKNAIEKEIYTCPMHPEVKSDKPGKCPKCGMELQKKMIVMKKEHKHMHVDMHKAEDKACCAIMKLTGCEDIEMKFENTEDGVMLKITSKNAEMVKKIQEKAAKMKTMCSHEASCCKKEAKKEEAKK